MKILVTGSAGHLGEALMRTLADSPHDALGVDLKPSPYTHRVGSIADRPFVNDCLPGVGAVLHAATLHKPHIATHTRQNFVDANITGTLNLLEAAAAVNVKAFVYTSTTSTFGRALIPPPDQPAAWITEESACLPKNIYGTTKFAAEQLCELFHVEQGMPCVVLRTSRFFPEDDDDPAARTAYGDDNLKVNELLFRRVDLQDAVAAHLLAMEQAPALGFDRFIISATAPFARDDLGELRRDARSVVQRYVPQFEEVYQRSGWSLMPAIDRVYINQRARARLGWRPAYDFAGAIAQLRAAGDYRSPLARAVVSKGY